MIEQSILKSHQSIGELEDHLDRYSIRYNHWQRLVNVSRILLVILLIVLIIEASAIASNDPSPFSMFDRDFVITFLLQMTAYITISALGQFYGSRWFIRKLDVQRIEGHPHFKQISSDYYEATISLCFGLGNLNQFWLSWEVFLFCIVVSAPFLLNAISIFTRNRMFVAMITVEVMLNIHLRMMTSIVQLPDDLSTLKE